MKRDLCDEIIACLPHGRTLFSYFRDRYALLMLSYAAERDPRVAKLKQSPFAPLLSKPLVKSALAQRGDGRVSIAELRDYWQPGGQAFLLTLGRWGCDQDNGWYQTSRAGWNLVLRLNFNRGHDRTLSQLLGTDRTGIFNAHCHPVMKSGERDYFRETLAWARIDLDLERNEALIEEIQSDWVREANWEKSSAELGWRRRRSEADPAQLKRYVEEILRPYARVWEEAMLTAALRFILDEVGIRNIWYHSHQGGAALKRISGDLPPRSLYSRLPERFCFSKTEEAPRFLAETRRYRKTERRVGGVPWYRLQL